MSNCLVLPGNARLSHWSSDVITTANDEPLSISIPSKKLKTKTKTKQVISTQIKQQYFSFTRGEPPRQNNRNQRKQFHEKGDIYGERGIEKRSWRRLPDSVCAPYVNPMQMKGRLTSFFFFWPNRFPRHCLCNRATQASHGAQSHGQVREVIDAQALRSV